MPQARTARLATSLCSIAADTGLADLGVGAGDEAAGEGSCQCGVGRGSLAPAAAMASGARAIVRLIATSSALRTSSRMRMRGRQRDAQARRAGGTVGGRIAGTHRPCASRLAPSASAVGVVADDDRLDRGADRPVASRVRGAARRPRTQLRDQRARCARRAAPSSPLDDVAGWSAAHGPAPAARRWCRCRRARAGSAVRSTLACAATKAPPTPAALPSVPM